MPYLEKIYISNFKNYQELEISDFSPRLNCLVGENGVGKTNFLDAIHYLCLTKSAFQATDYQNIYQNERFFSLNAHFNIKQHSQQVLCVVQRGEKKIIKHNHSEYQKLTEHIGEIPLVLLTPYDTDLIREGSEERRRFFDSLICQMDSAYLHNLLEYNHLLKNRNSLLKQFAEKNNFDSNLLETFNERLLKQMKHIYAVRKQVLEAFVMIFQKIYETLTGAKEKVSLQYSSQIDDYEDYTSFSKVFLEATQKDRALQRTTLGIHKDDFVFEIQEQAVKKFGSQGQQKSYIIALKLAKFEMLRQNTQKMPILLLDDIFDKLDASRTQKLLEMVTSENFGQVFLTDATPERMKTLLQNMAVEHRFLEVYKTDQSAFIR
jgi:DNA replication and repair protein RecF